MSSRNGYVLYNRACGHVGLAVGDREQGEACVRRLIEAGYSQWRIRCATDEDLLSLVEPQDCDVCRVAPAEPDPTADIAILPTVCLDRPAEVEAAKQWTHDELIQLAGPLRKSGIRWLIRTGRDECTELMIEMYPGESDRISPFLGYFDVHAEDCVLVVASCEVSAQ